jgi:hypothetical protein
MREAGFAGETGYIGAYLGPEDDVEIVDEHVEACGPTTNPTWC